MRREGNRLKEQSIAAQRARRDKAAATQGESTQGESTQAKLDAMRRKVDHDHQHGASELPRPPPKAYAGMSDSESQGGFNMLDTVPRLFMLTALHAPHVQGVHHVQPMQHVQPAQHPLIAYPLPVHTSHAHAPAVVYHAGQNPAQFHCIPHVQPAREDPAATLKRMLDLSKGPEHVVNIHVGDKNHGHRDHADPNDKHVNHTHNRTIHNTYNTRHEEHKHAHMYVGGSQPPVGMKGMGTSHHHAHGTGGDSRLLEGHSPKSPQFLRLK